MKIQIESIQQDPSSNSDGIQYNYKLRCGDKVIQGRVVTLISVDDQGSIDHVRPLDEKPFKIIAQAGGIKSFIHEVWNVRRGRPKALPWSYDDLPEGAVNNILTTS